jgi:hypothetical protein
VSLVDSIFSPLAPLLINQFGSSLTFIRRADGVYNDTTGVITSAEQRYNIKAVFESLRADEIGGIYQATDVRIFFDPTAIGGGVVTTEDRVEYSRAGQTVTAKVVNPTEYRGDSPILFDVVVRPE